MLNVAIYVSRGAVSRFAIALCRSALDVTQRLLEIGEPMTHRPRWLGPPLAPFAVGLPLAP